MAKSNNEVDYTGINLLANGTSINGEINSSGDIRIDGALNGNLNTKGKVVIGDTGVVIGEINCRNADVLGRIEGKIFVAELLSLKSTAVVLGDIKINKLAIEPGCKFNGNCSMIENGSQDSKIGRQIEEYSKATS